MNEMNSMSLYLQGKLLTFLDTKSYDRLGGQSGVTANVRIIAATNKDLKKMVDEGSFREDLFFRLKVLEIELPPLRKRKRDIPELVSEFLETLAKELGVMYVPLDGLVMEELVNYAWPGNVRELRNRLERALVFANGPSIGLLDVFPERAAQLKLKVARMMDYEETPTYNDHGLPESVGFPLGEEWTYNEAVNEFKLSLIEEAMRRAGGNQTEAAKLLGMPTRFALRRQMKTLGYAVPK